MFVCSLEEPCAQRPQKKDANKSEERLVGEGGVGMSHLFRCLCSQFQLSSLLYTTCETRTSPIHVVAHGRGTHMSHSTENRAQTSQQRRHVVVTS